MAAGDVGAPKRYYSATATESELSGNMPAQSQGATYSSMIVTTTSGFPTNTPYTLIIDPDTSKEEVVTVQSVVGTTLTVIRGENNTQAVAHSGAAVVRHGVSAREFTELQTHISARGYDTDSGIMADSHVRGIATGDGVVVGTAKTQTLTNKTISGGTVTGSITATSATFTGGTFTSSTITSATITSSTVRSSTITSSTVTSSTIASGTLGTDLAAGGYKVTGLATPTATADAATKGYVDTQVANLVASAPAALDTLNELAAAIGNDASFSTTVANNIATKLPKAGGTMSGAIDMGSNKITSLATPTAGTDAVNKTYIDTLYGSTASAAVSATAAATSATSAAASATAAATSATSAAASASASATSATQASASSSAAATSATSAATSATAAATSATSAAASATAAATSASSAAASATTATTQAGNASASAVGAATSATAAATSATSAAASATAAATSASSAATSASSAATTYTQYDQRYLGSKTSAPSLDNQGNALITGATYWNSTSSQMYAWTGSAWSAISTANPYSAPTLGSTTIASGTTYSNINGLTINSTTIPTSKTLVVTTDKLSVHAATTSAELAGVISDETGSGSLVFGTAPTIAGATISGTFTSTATISGGTLSGNTHTNSTLSGTLTAGASSGVNGQYLQSTGTGVQWANVTTYSAPTIGSTSIGSGATVSTISALTLNNSTLTGTLTAASSAGVSGQFLQTTGTGVQWASVVTDATPDIFMLMGA